ncbi:DNA-directed RNA polymerase subunit delta [Alicyclobacillus kakegawensis]|uniref:DNA-directed RNA polymerase subunit delta n=1 Tax=Alicyclobacillus kakegawensis TaxID=392012 RepID=UPI00082CBCD7|nr:DNA-directed RNA polymerase subunit delta [Alicyclobacillus kakegawensis]
MAVALSKSQDEILQMPLVELAWEILRVRKEPCYFRDLVAEVQELRGMTDEEVMEVIARLYTEINIDGRFVCLGQNTWGLRRWYPVDRTAEKALSNKRFVRKSGDAFSDDDEDVDVDEYENDEDVLEDDEVAVDDEDLEDVDLTDEDQDSDDIETDDLDADSDEDLGEDEASELLTEEDLDESLDGEDSKY